MEIWKDIPGFDGQYQASSHGRIRSLSRQLKLKNGFSRNHLGRILKEFTDRDGYRHVKLSKNNQVKLYRVHRAVAKAFIPNLLNLPQINHKDEVKDNNVAGNLEWCDNLYNTRYGTAIQRKANTRRGKPFVNGRGEKSKTSKLKEHQVISIFKDPRSYKDICADYGVCKSTVSGIKLKRNWQYLLEAI